jgi:adenosine deaminase
MTRLCRYFSTLILACLWAAPVLAQLNAQAPNYSAQVTSEQRTAHALNAAKANPLDLRAFLVGMPKGGDLHMHLTGAVYAESWIAEGAEDQLCVDIASMSFVSPAAGNATSGVSCDKGEVPAAQAYKDQHLYDALIDAFSMRGFVPSAGVTSHDHFFDAFPRFILIDGRHAGEWLDEVATRAASQNEQYLEIMVTPPFDHTAALAQQLNWRANQSWPDFRDQLLAKGLRDDIALARAYLDTAEWIRNQSERCGTATATPACSVQIRYLYQVLRAFPPSQVFAQTLLGFEVAAADPRVLGINYVQPEDNYVAMSNYMLHMRMVAFFHNLYPKTHISLHAGELAPGLVPPEGLCCHIRSAIEAASAERIGHGADVMYEDRPYDLLKEMAAKHVMVEINLTSNDVILGLAGKNHPLPIYRRFGVPVALSTDDEGVSRIDLTHEYVRAVETYGLTYPDLKQMVRASLEHSFLAGASLWRDRDRFNRPVAACAQDSLGAQHRSPVCMEFLQSSERAQQQWELEGRFLSFEASH